MTSSKACLAAALCSLVILSTFVGSVQSASCCLRYVRHSISCRRVLDYSVQTINQSCDINAIVFHIRGRFLCADPTFKATQRCMRYINEKKRLIEQLINKDIKAIKAPA